MLNTKDCYLKQLIYCYNNTNFIAFSSGKDNFLRCKIHSTILELNSELTHFVTFMNNGRAVSRLDGMACIYQCFDQFQLLPGRWQAKRCWISWDFEKPNLSEHNPNNTRNNMKSQIQNKRNGGSIICRITNTNITQSY